MTVTYSVNGKNVRFEDLKKLEITKKDYIDYVEAIKKTANDFHKGQKR